MSAVRTGAPVRFIGRVGADAVGNALVSEMLNSGVDARVQRAGCTGTIVVLVDTEGERSMLPDRAAAVDLQDVNAADLDGVTWLHLPAYSLVAEPLASTSRWAIDRVHDVGGALSIDASSVAIIDQMGAGQFTSMIADLGPDVVFCNEDEAAALDVHQSSGLEGAALTVVKTGSGDAIAYGMAKVVARHPAVAVPDVRDTTGAGDAFAAGFIAERMRSGGVGAALAAGHKTAAELIVLHSP